MNGAGGVAGLGKENLAHPNAAQPREGNSNAGQTPPKRATVDSASCLMEELQEELTCSICLEICVLPSTTACGHSFCRRCLKRALAADRDRRCPKCRVQLPDQPLAVHSVLWNVIQTLFPTHALEAVKTQAPATPLPAEPFVKHRTRGFVGVRTASHRRAAGPTIYPPSYRVDVDEAPSFRIEVEEEAPVLESASDDESDEAAEAAFWEATGMATPEGVFLGASQRSVGRRAAASRERGSLWDRVVAAEQSARVEDELTAGLLSGMSALGLSDRLVGVASSPSSPTRGRAGAIRLEPSRHRAEEREARRAQQQQGGGGESHPVSSSSRTALDDVLNQIPRDGVRLGHSPTQQRPLSRQGSRRQNIFMRQPNPHRRQQLSRSNSAVTSDTRGGSSGVTAHSASAEESDSQVVDLPVEAHPVRFQSDGERSPVTILLSSDDDEPDGGDDVEHRGNLFSPPPSRATTLYSRAQAQLHALQLEVAGTDRLATSRRHRSSQRRV